MIHIYVGNTILIHGLPHGLKEHLKKTLTIKNKDYHMLKARGVSPYALKEFFTYYLEHSHALEIPRGMRGRLLEFLKKIDARYEIEENYVDKKRNEQILSTFKPRDYQIPIIDQCVKAREGIIHMGTGTGKTATALDIIFKIGGTATILVPKTDLLEQFKEESERFFGYSPGIIYAKKKEIKDVTISTFQSLESDRELLERLAKHTTTLVVDECQNAVSKVRSSTLDSFSPKHLFGLTATPVRDDGLTEAIFFTFGNRICEYNQTQLTPSVDVYVTDVPIDYDEYHIMVESMVENQSRNKLIAGLVLTEVLAGRKVLVLTKRIRHYQLIRDMLPDSDVFFYIDSDDKERNKTLMDFKQNRREFSAIFGTTSLLSVGTDIPALDTVIIACDMAGEVITTQSVGRALRLFEGKPQPKIIDLWDNKSRKFSDQFKKRLKLYRDKGWEVNRLPDFMK